MECGSLLPLFPAELAPPPASAASEFFSNLLYFAAPLFQQSPEHEATQYSAQYPPCRWTARDCRAQRNLRRVRPAFPLRRFAARLLVRRSKTQRCAARHTARSAQCSTLPVPPLPRTRRSRGLMILYRPQKPTSLLKVHTSSRYSEPP